MMGAACDAYRAIHAESDDPYPGINAATLALLAGREAQAAALAEALLRHPRLTDNADYYAV